MAELSALMECIERGWLFWIKIPNFGHNNLSDFLTYYCGVRFYFLAFKNPSHPNDYWKKSYDGRCMLTSRRVIFLAKDKKSNLRDFVMPFSVIKNWELKQPIFGQNYISSTIKAAPGGSSFIARFRYSVI